MKIFAVLALIAMGVVLLYPLQEVSPVGATDSPPSKNVSPRYIERGYQETGAQNLVTGVLADYRAFDTLGECAVIFAGGLACALILIYPLRRKKGGSA